MNFKFYDDCTCTYSLNINKKILESFKHTKFKNTKTNHLRDNENRLDVCYCFKTINIYIIAICKKKNIGMKCILLLLLTFLFPTKPGN